MSRVLKWNVDETPALTPEEEAGLVEALRALDRGEGESAREVRRAIGKALKR